MYSGMVDLYFISRCLTTVVIVFQTLGAHTHTHIHTYIHTYTHTHSHTHTHTHTHIHSHSFTRQTFRNSVNTVKPNEFTLVLLNQIVLLNIFLSQMGKKVKRMFQRC